ncbi:hypothetical protein H5410_043540 [Solanum commersonii]|uniref:Uncharacterized protein n=1 Tax=Solanum commersonii TaxID=4109 RepID=A0A9J5XZ53_SOLCO|nr:hypothetical protein H5410_043540 [Solanum commersonii]
MWRFSHKIEPKTSSLSFTASPIHPQGLSTPLKTLVIAKCHLELHEIRLIFDRVEMRQDGPNFRTILKVLLF